MSELDPKTDSAVIAAQKKLEEKGEWALTPGETFLLGHVGILKKSELRPWLEQQRIARMSEEADPVPSLPKVTYEPDNSGESWWCNTHTREAKYIQRGGLNDGEHRCKGGGIMLTCRCVKS